MFKKLKLDELNRVDIETFKRSNKNSVCVILDEVRSMNNVGSIFRTCDGFGIDTLYLCGITAQPPHREIHKTALGAEDSVNWHYHSSTEELCKQLINDGFTLLAVEQVAESTPLGTFQLDPNKKYGIIFGNEVEGVNENVLKYCETCIEIPQFGTKHSFNVSVCAGIILWELLN